MPPLNRQAVRKLSKADLYKMIQNLENQLGAMSVKFNAVAQVVEKSNAVTAQFIAVIQILKDEGILTDEQLTDYNNKNQEAIKQSRLQSEGTGSDESDSGSERSELLDAESGGTPPAVFDRDADE